MRSLLSALLLVCCASPVFAQKMEYPLALAATEDGSLFVADRTLPGIWKVKDGKAELYFKASKMFRTPLNAVRCLAIDEKGRLLAGDSATREVYRFDENGKPFPLTNGGIGIPMAIAVAKKGDIFVADLELHRIWKVPSLGGEPEEFAVIQAPRGMTIDSQDRLWIVSYGKNQLLRVLPDKTIETVIEGQPFEFPHHIVLGENDIPFIIDGYAKTLWKVVDGKPVAFVQGEPLKNPVGLAIHDKTIYIADPHQKAIFSVDAAGKLEKVYSASAE
jgi:sugar lactone lactonase YvrE